MISLTFTMALRAAFLFSPAIAPPLHCVPREPAPLDANETLVQPCSPGESCRERWIFRSRSLTVPNI